MDAQGKQNGSSVDVVAATIIYLVVWLGLCAAFAVGIGSINLPTLRTLAKYGVPTEGKVEAKEPDNHQVVRYSYVVGQRSYNGSGRAGYGNPEFISLSVGDKVTVFYDPSDPQLSIMGNPQEQLSNELVSVGAVTLLFPPIIMLGLYMRGVLPRAERAR